MATLPNRTCTLTLLQEGTGKTAQVHISQDVKPFVPEYVLEVLAKAYNVPAEGQTLTIPFTSYRTAKGGRREPVALIDRSTPASGAQMTDEGTDGTGGTITLTIPRTDSYEPRELTYTFAQEEGKSVTITVQQAAKADDGVFTAEPMILRYQAAGGTATSAVTSTSKGKTVGWSVSNKADLPDWVTLSGEGTDTLTITTTSNE